MTALKLTQIGNSVGVILPKETLARLKLTMQSVAAGEIDEAALPPGFASTCNHFDALHAQYAVKLY